MPRSTRKFPPQSPMDSCNDQIAVFGGTSCTVHNYPNNNGDVGYSQSDKLLFVGMVTALGVVYALYRLCIIWTGQRAEQPRVYHAGPPEISSGEKRSRFESTV